MIPGNPRGCFGATTGPTSSHIRIVLGAILVALFFVAAGPCKWVALIAGIVAIATGVLRFCGLYKLLGINTCKTA